MFAFVEDDKIIGYYSLALQANNECELNNLCVLPQFRHQKMSRGKKMYPRIRAMREDRDLKQVQVAAILNMSQTGYSKYETGENDIPTAVLIKLARFYDTSIDYLLGETDNPKRY